MARKRILDYMQAYPFWLLDISPSLQFPFFVFLPIMGFHSISSPELNAETSEIQPGNSIFKKYVVTRSGVSSLTLSRGARFFDNEYWFWIKDAIFGDSPKIKRDLMLIHYLSYTPGHIRSAINKVGLQAIGVDIHSGIARIPGRAWILRKCLPIRYKAGSDFDATSGEVSLMELDIQPEYFEEIGLSERFSQFLK